MSKKITKKLTKKELIKHLLKVYQQALTEGSKMNHKRFLRFLNKKDLVCGVCAYIIHKDLLSYSTKWIDKHCTYPGAFTSSVYWAKRPIDTTSKEEAVETLKTRISILKKELKHCK